MNKTANISAMIAAAAFGSINLFGCKSDDTDTANEKELEMLKKAVEDYTKATPEAEKAKSGDKCKVVMDKFDKDHKSWADKYKDMFSKMSTDDKKAADEKWKSKIAEQKKAMDAARAACFTAGGAKDPVQPEALSAAQKKKKAEDFFTDETKFHQDLQKKFEALTKDAKQTKEQRMAAFDKHKSEQYGDYLKIRIVQDGTRPTWPKFDKKKGTDGINSHDLVDLVGGPAATVYSRFAVAVADCSNAADECLIAIQGITAEQVQAFFQPKTDAVIAVAEEYSAAAADEDSLTKEVYDAIRAKESPLWTPIQAGAPSAEEQAQEPEWMVFYNQLSEEKQAELQLPKDAAEDDESEAVTYDMALEAMNAARIECFWKIPESVEQAKAYMTAAAALQEEYKNKMSAQEVTKLSGPELGKVSAKIFAEGVAKFAELASNAANKQLVDDMKAVMKKPEEATELVGADAWNAYMTVEKALRSLGKAQSETMNSRAEWHYHDHLMFMTKKGVDQFNDYLAHINGGKPNSHLNSPDAAPGSENSSKKRSASRRKSKSGNLSPGDGNGF